MSNKVIVYSEGNNSLTDFQTIIQQQEDIIGPLIAFAKEGDKNAITLEDGPTPENQTILELYNGENPHDKDGYKHVCHGLCFVGGEEKNVAAYRKT